MTLKNISEKTGFSVSTVSKAFSYSTEISPETRKKIFDAARELGTLEKYTSGKYEKKIIAVICPELKSEFYTHMLSILEEKITQKDGIMTVSVSGFSKERAQSLYNYHTSYQKADGVIMLGGSYDVNNPLNIPTVCTGGRKKQKNADTVSVQISGAVDKAVSYLKETGHREIAFIGDGLTGSKKDNYLSAMRKCSMPVRKQLIITSPSRFEKAGSEAAEILLGGDIFPDAVIAAYDYIALGFIESLKKYGLSVPENISVIGMDDISTCSYLQSPLTTIKTHIDELCDTILDILFKKINNKFYFTREHITITGELVIRDSTAPKNR